MEAKRKPKGEEGGSIQLRDLNAETLNNIHELRKYFCVGTNSKAVLLAVRQFVFMKDELLFLREKLEEANKTIEEQRSALEQIENVIDTFRSRKKRK